MIYFIQAENNTIKIGYSKQPLSRLSELQVGSAHPLKLLAVIPGGPKKEKELHTRLQKYKLNGDWFKPEPEVINLVQGFIPASMSYEICKICGALIAPDDHKDIEAHSKQHAVILKGGLPFELCELLKASGWEMANSDDGKRAIAFAWWAKARRGGLPDEALEDYILDAFEYIEALISKDKDRDEQVSKRLHDKWGDYLG